MKSSQVPRQIGIPFGKSGKRNTVPDTPKVGAAENLSSYDTGFPEITMQPIGAGGLPPFGQDFNGVMYDVTQNIMWYSAGMLYQYSLNYAKTIGGYPKGALLLNKARDGIWLSIAEDNIENPDAGTPKQWINPYRRDDVDTGAYLKKANNLSDVSNKAESLKNINGLDKDMNLSDIANKPAAMKNLGGVLKTGDDMTGTLNIKVSNSPTLNLRNSVANGGVYINLYSGTSTLDGFIGYEKAGDTGLQLHSIRGNSSLALFPEQVKLTMAGANVSIERNGNIVGSIWETS